MRIKLAILLTLLILASGCEKLFHPEEDPSGLIRNYDELSSAVEGVYGLLASYINEYDTLNIKGDDLNIKVVYEFSTSSRDTTFIRDIFSYNDYYSWAKLYKIIIASNNIIYQIGNIQSLDKQYSNILAEIYYLRAYCYFRLTRLYAQIPLIEDIDINYDISLASYKEIYEFIERDLQTAINYLPNNNSEARIPYVTPHRGVAKALLAEVYLNWAGYPTKDTEKYTKSAQLAGEVIDSSSYFGFRLMNDFAEVWDSNNFYCDEGVFSLYFSNISNYTNLTYEGCYGGRVKLYNQQFKYFMRFQLAYLVDLDFLPVETNFYNSYPSCYRKDITFYTDIFIIDVYNPYNDPYGHIEHLDSINYKYIMHYRKFYLTPRLIDYDNIDGSPNTYYYVGSSKIYVYRYAQTLLTYAEAKARAGQPDAMAYNAVNMIRRRAYHLDINTPCAYDISTGLAASQFADSVVWERALELCGEPEGRWFDLLRLEKVEDLNTLRDPLEGGPPVLPATKADYFNTKPSTDIDLNPNL